MTSCICNAPICFSELPHMLLRLLLLKLITKERYFVIEETNLINQPAVSGLQSKTYSQGNP